MNNESEMISNFTDKNGTMIANNNEVLYQDETFIVLEKNNNWYIHPTGNTNQGDIPLDEVYNQLEII